MHICMYACLHVCNSLCIALHIFGKGMEWNEMECNGMKSGEGIVKQSVYVSVCKCMYVYVCVCMSKYVYVCVCMCMYEFMNVWMHVCMQESNYLSSFPFLPFLSFPFLSFPFLLSFFLPSCIYLCYPCSCVSMYICTYACLHATMYASMSITKVCGDVGMYECRIVGV